MPEIKLKCSCGKVKGKTKDVNESSGTRVVCCCDDCQSFAGYLNQESSVLDQYGGTDIFQMPISNIKIIEGIEQISSVRLSAKGMYRWHTRCCNTPIGNSMGAGVPFIGLIHNFMDNASARDEELGENRGHIQTKFARQEVPTDLKGSSFKIIFRSLSKLLVWKIKGLNKPSTFFDDNEKPIAKPNVLN
ncbi:MAG: DUF6151 family protein [Bermanella sp.]